MDYRQLSELQKILPKIAGINGKEEYFNSAVLVLLVLIGEEYHFLFEKRNLNIRQGGEICFPGGRFDPELDRDYEEAAIRETVEELGVSKGQIKIIGKLDTVLSSFGASIDAFLATADIKHIEELSINRNEVEYIFTIPVAHFVENEPEKYKIRLEVHPSYINKDGEEVILFPAKELGLPERYTKPWGNGQINIYAYKTDHGVIWGITARLIYDLAKKIKSLTYN